VSLVQILFIAASTIAVGTLLLATLLIVLGSLLRSTNISRFGARQIVLGIAFQLLLICFAQLLVAVLIGLSRDAWVLFLTWPLGLAFGGLALLALRTFLRGGDVRDWLSTSRTNLPRGR
jgi:hypothetical protein